MVNENSPMSDVLAGLQRAEYAACHEFCRRQRSGLLDVLIAGADRLGDIARELELRQPATLLGWKFPDSYAPVESLPALLDAACEGREDDIYRMLADSPFSDLAATASACSYIRSSAAQIKRYGAAPRDPQRSLI